MDLSSLERALASLDRAIARARSAPADLEVRDSVIQRFEYTYELSWRLLKRRIELDSPTPAAVDALSFRELMREGAERGLIADPEAWFTYRRQRNLTAHTYNEATAQEVFASAMDFAAAARSLLVALEGRARDDEGG